MAVSFAYSAYADYYDDDYAAMSHPHSNNGPPPAIPIDPALTLYPPYYPQYNQHLPHQHHLYVSSPSSQGSDTLGTPPTEHMYPSNVNGKRPASTDTLASDARKKSRKDEESEEKDEPKQKSTRGSRACTVCRRLKMKCVGAEQGGPCKRCATGGHECIFEESNRGKRASKKNEFLTRSLRKMERTLDTVLRSIGNPGITSGMVSRSPSPSAQAAGTSALLADADMPSPHDGGSSYAGHGQQQGSTGSPKLHSLPDNALNPLGLLAEASLANRRVQHPGASPMLARGVPGGDKPQMGVASDNYFKPALSSACRDANVNATVCSIAAKFYTAKPDLHPRLTELAKKLAFSVPAAGYKSLEIVQAYLLLSLWGCGAVERYEQDKTWLLLGMGIRAIIRNASKWCNAPIAAPSDPSLCAYAELQRVLSRCLDFLYSGTDTASGLQVHCDYMLVIKSFEAQLHTWKDRWVLSREWRGNDQRALEYKKLIAQFYYNYAILIVNSFGLQNAMERSPVDLAHFFSQCHSAATKCALLVKDELGPRGFMRYAPDSHNVFVSYALLTLLKLIRPEFHPYLDDEQRTLALVSDVADTLEKSAANPTHTPALYSHFLRALINAKANGSAENNGVDGADLAAAAAFQAQGQGTDPATTLTSASATSAPTTPAIAHTTANANGTPNVGPYYMGYAGEPGAYNPFSFESEMGPVADMSVFPPTMAPNPPPPEDGMNGMHGTGGLTMDNILSTGFWDSVIVPGYNSMDGLSGGFLFGAGGSGLITPRYGMSPSQSGANTPAVGRSAAAAAHALTQFNINAAFEQSQMEAGKVEG
ncbi:hypothetical protein H0H92_009192 [Tricholoma furcatifolium]|nr:hypothetical protein H0H92_009192 [Tricholoma furcatifolium]